MLEELEKIDVSTIQDLCTIKEEQQTLRERLDTMEEHRDEVSEAVFVRVHADYSTRYDRLEEEARPLKSRAKAEYARLMILNEKLGKAVESARLAKEELGFRHELGEFEEGEFETRSGECDEALAKSEGDLADGEKLKERFIEAFHSEEELLSGTETLPPEPVPEAQVGEAEDDSSSEAKPDEGPADSVEVADEKGEEQSVEDTAELMEPEATAMLGLPRFVAVAEDGTEEVFTLSPTGTTIGRLDTNDICIPEGTVSRQHAKVELTTAGFTLFDLGSENGMYVNGERTVEHLLQEGDRVEIGRGTKEFVFHTE
ncbi:MAG: FHA domain-containing protein [Thermoanaerobaculales bacterium]